MRAIKLLSFWTFRYEMGFIGHDSKGKPEIVTQYTDRWTCFIRMVGTPS